MKEPWLSFIGVKWLIGITWKSRICGVARRGLVDRRKRIRIFQNYEYNEEIATPGPRGIVMALFKNRAAVKINVDKEVIPTSWKLNYQGPKKGFFHC